MPDLTPYPSLNFGKQCELVIAQSFGVSFSGEFTADKLGAPIGVVKRAGKISNVFLSCLAGGRDDDNTLSVTCDVYINGTTCLTTPPVIAYVSGEASMFKTTKVSGEQAGGTKAVMDDDATSFDPGDVITYDLVLTRTSSPDVEMNTPCIVVELSPAI